MTNVLVEGGGRVLGAFFDAGEVDEVDVFVAPIIEGGTHDFTPARGVGVDAMRRGDSGSTTPTVSLVDGDVRIRGDRRPAPHRPRRRPGLDAAATVIVIIIDRL